MGMGAWEPNRAGLAHSRPRALSASPAASMLAASAAPASGNPCEIPVSSVQPCK
eukprot:CAMPEP_0195059058 /NCGR_PEP_ID=MMETSP0448-20130528/6644_1 /TAXON_ID=66468 /ORGANISM="Heterocapsa triquestra, Strain CCMP 448" /LENGTH=53 /DNA_ID=CAMNT_0040089265 /DNA_START=202 /DNA_END=360 /DNA_ORIENTATION=-